MTTLDKILFVFLFTMLFGMIGAIIYLGPADVRRPYSRIEFIEYFQDSNTNICFATVKEKSFTREFITSVQCTDEVHKQIKK